ncbi:hypothetical protein ACFRIC_28870 [Streptomyces sp. NPDC056738]|uniref:hypothetical protein n=1 Tax=Streptomyces sp. NPDC056738 TaxID=3345933 RepID=UPI0036B80484
MTDKPESNGQLMSRLIRDVPIKPKAQAMLDHLRRDWTNPTTTTDEETDRA